MSTAELTACSSSSETNQLDANALSLSPSEKAMRAKQALQDAKEGNSYSTEELCASIDAKYPWLCD